MRAILQLPVACLLLTHPALCLWSSTGLQAAPCGQRGCAAPPGVAASGSRDTVVVLDAAEGDLDCTDLVDKPMWLLELGPAAAVTADRISFSVGLGSLATWCGFIRGEAGSVCLTWKADDPCNAKHFVLHAVRQGGTQKQRTIYQAQALATSTAQGSGRRAQSSSTISVSHVKYNLPESSGLGKGIVFANEVTTAAPTFAPTFAPTLAPTLAPISAITDSVSEHRLTGDVARQRPEPAPRRAQVANTVVDLLVVWTPAAEFQMGGYDATFSKMKLQFELAQNAFTASRLGITLNVVHFGRVEYSEPPPCTANARCVSPSGIALNDIQLGKVGDTLQLREQYGADLVQLVLSGLQRGQDTAAGWGMTYGGPGFTQSFATTVRWHHMEDAYVHVHELGHNFGGMHDRDNMDNPERAYLPYAFGHRACGSGGFRSVMSYNQDCYRNNELQLPLFSSPEALSWAQFKGPSGNVDNDNRRAILRTKDTIAAFKERVVVDVDTGDTTPTPPPTQLPTDTDTEEPPPSEGRQLWPVQLVTRKDPTRCMSLQAGATSLTMAPCAAFTNFYFVHQSGMLKLFDDTSLCVTAGTVDAPRATARPCDGSSAQSFVVDTAGLQQVFVAAAGVGSEVCLDYEPSSDAVYMGPAASAGLNQQWLFPHFITSAYDAEVCLTATSNSALVTMKACELADNLTKWIYSSEGRLHNVAFGEDDCLVYDAAAAASADRVRLARCDGTVEPYQQWFYVLSTGKLTSAADSDGLCLDQAVNAELLMAECADRRPQKWNLFDITQM